MFDKLDFITEKYQELSEKVADPAIISDQKTWQKYMKEMAEIEPIVKSYESYRKMQSDLADAREIIDMEDDEEMRELAKEEAKSWEQMSIPDHMQIYLDQGMDRKSAMKKVAKDRGVGKREIYQALLDED